MSTTVGPRASTATPVTVQTDDHGQQGPRSVRDDVGDGTSMFVNMRVASILVRYARQRAVTRMFGVPAEDQSSLVTLTLLGTVATVGGSVVVRLIPRPSGTDLAIGGVVANTGLRGIAGPPAAGIPLAGALIAFAVVAHSLRPAVAETVRETRRMVDESRAALKWVLGPPRA
jgi:hypothetical protein